MSSLAQKPSTVEDLYALPADERHHELVRCYRNLLEPKVVTASETLEADDRLPGFRLPVAEIFAM